jgi:hypothetical protein
MKSLPIVDREGRVDLTVGYSDHTGNPFVILKAIELGAQVIEMHFDLNDQKGSETYHGHCWTQASASRLFSYLQIMDFAKGGAQPTKEMLKMKADVKTGMRL